MDSETAVELLLQSQTKTEVLLAIRTEEKMARSEDKVGQRASAQTRTEQSLQSLIKSLKSPRNGNP
jgi:hypothetical protein